jgi:hypothetical protein
VVLIADTVFAAGVLPAPECLLRFYGEDRLTVVIRPVAPDGLLVVCSVALLAIAEDVRRNHERKPAVIRAINA